jgi:hypothetical protein
MNNVPKTSEKLHHFYSGLNETLAWFRRTIAPKVKEAHNVDAGGFIRLRDVGEAGNSASQLFTRISRNPIEAGDRVLVGYLEDGEAVVLGKLLESGEDDSAGAGIDLSENGIVEIVGATTVDFDTGLRITAGSVEFDLAWGDLRYIRRAAPPYSTYGHLQGSRYVSLLNLYPIGTLTGITLTANRIYYTPVWVPKDVTIAGVTYNVTTNVTGNVRVGFYECDSAFMPSIIIGQSTAVSQSTTGVKTQAFAAPLALEGGRWYFAALVSATARAISGNNTAGAFPAFRGGASGSYGESFILGAHEDAGSTNLPAIANPASGSTNTYIHLAGYQ